MPRLTLSISNFLGGVAPSAYSGDYRSQADPTTFGWDSANIIDMGLLRRGFGLTTVTGASIITGSVRWVKTYGSFTPYAYAYEENTNPTANRLHRINVSTHTVTPSGTFPATLNTYSESNGMELYDGYLYYATGQYLGRYDLNTTFDNSFYLSLGTTCLGATIRHPMVQGYGKLFIGNSYTNASLTNACSVAKIEAGVVTADALPLGKTQKVVKCLEFHNANLYIGLSSNLYGDRTIRCDTSMLVWDTVSPGWQKEIPFPEEDIVALKSWNGSLYAWGARGVYVFNGTGFSQIFLTPAGPNLSSEVDVSPYGLLYWKGTDSAANQGIYAYGALDERQTKVPFKPYFEYGGASQPIVWVNKDNLYVFGYSSGEKIRRFNSATDASYGTATWKSSMINMPGNAQIVDIKVMMASLPSGTSVTLGWAKDDGIAEDLITANTLGQTLIKTVPNGKISDEFQVYIKHTSGPTPKIHRIDIEYENIQE